MIVLLARAESGQISSRRCATDETYGERNRPVSCPSTFPSSTSGGPCIPISERKATCKP